jgi:enamine deaminase RidA (YjgF/YER057c/UK114 family)
MGPDERLSTLGIVLPEAPTPVGNYVSAVSTGSLLFLAGHGPVRPDGSLVRGKVGGDLDETAAREAARLVGLGLLATIRHELGSLDRVARVVKVLGMVNCVR